MYALVILNSGNGFFPVTGSVTYFDDLTMIYNSTSVKKENLSAEFLYLQGNHHILIQGGKADRYNSAKILDITGRMVWRGPVTADRIDISGADLKNGIYIASLYGNMSYMLLHDKQSELKQEVELKALIEERMEYFSDLAQSKGLHISLALSEKSLHVNEESMIKLIDNLLSNAIKYNDINGSIEIMLTQEFLSVKDSGVGIPQSKIKEITKRYKRANSDKGGFGIGLDIVSTICKTNGFRLEISSQEGEGSTFSIFF